MSLYGKAPRPQQTIEDVTRERDYIQMALDRSAIVAVTDAKGTIVHVNDKFCEISKYSFEELIGQNHRLINSGYHPREFFIDMWKTISSGKAWESEICNRAKDGSFYWVNTTIVPFLDKAGKPYQYVSIRFEITNMKKAELQLKEYAHRLELSNRELQDFASVAAHDLQEPLRKILTFAERLTTKSADALSVEAKDYLDRMQSAAMRMRTLINDLLSFSRVNTQAQPFAPISLSQVLSGVMSDLEVRIEQTKAQIEADTLPTIEADPSQMRQLFQNLISNALKFHKKNEHPVVSIKATQNQEFCEIRVKDNGIGFDEKYLDRIFTIFQRLHGRQEFEGTGVGLAVVRRIVERHKGTVTAVSRPGDGAEFIVRLPIRHIKE